MSNADITTNENKLLECGTGTACFKQPEQPFHSHIHDLVWSFLAGCQMDDMRHPIQRLFNNFTVFDVSNSLRERGWLLPAYTFPANRTDLAALRVVVKLGFTHDMADLLVKDIERQLPHLRAQPSPVRDASNSAGFHH